MYIYIDFETQETFPKQFSSKCFICASFFSYSVQEVKKKADFVYKLVTVIDCV